MRKSVEKPILVVLINLFELGKLVYDSEEVIEKSHSPDSLCVLNLLKINN